MDAGGAVDMLFAKRGAVGCTDAVSWSTEGAVPFTGVR